MWYKNLGVTYFRCCILLSHLPKIMTSAIISMHHSCEWKNQFRTFRKEKSVAFDDSTHTQHNTIVDFCAASCYFDSNLPRVDFRETLDTRSLLSVYSQFALNFYHIYFNFIFDPQRDTFWINFAVRAHIRIFQTFRICINFYPILKIEPAMLDLLSTFLDMLWEQKIGFFAFFSLGNSDTFYVC